MKEAFVSITFSYAPGVIDRVGKAFEITRTRGGGFEITIDDQMKGRQHTVLSCMKNAMEDIYLNRVRV